MAIAGSDIHVRMATTAGSAGNTNAPGAAGSSLGKYISNADITDNTEGNLFPDVTGAENAASNVDYQCLFVYNANGSDTWQNVYAWIASQVAGGTTLAIGVDPTAASAVGGSSAQAVTIANKNTAPAGVTFSSPTSFAAGIALGNIAPGDCVAIWIQRTDTNSAAVTGDGGEISFQGDTVA